jgi:hypothetical protein
MLQTFPKLWDTRVEIWTVDCAGFGCGCDQSYNISVPRDTQGEACPKYATLAPMSVCQLEAGGSKVLKVVPCGVAALKGAVHPEQGFQANYVIKELVKRLHQATDWLVSGGVHCYVRQ